VVESSVVSLANGEFYGLCFKWVVLEVEQGLWFVNYHCWQPLPTMPGLQCGKTVRWDNQ